ncbi:MULTISPECIES: BLUF domain-containing protein [Chromobacterium]|uniref:BLUF domain-containing protein n=2 Tax=Chromobacterium TaxID=535 RepID=A0ABS3GNZ0_9NEIS|nr:MULTISPECIES: BLUF domain-containing protein [Chromobacterium]AXT45590.1 BLUF domain-containing protein [Chromobacterium rhizoryzae]MBK0414423.1 BLUF domain-containing protein [Chromobacterium haemolyticum]MBO0415943.1 BLUF domain-containing protein [Chromobacterium haemolyticum]MBO0499203.1 BLUF domain-containing protein [Chromobacterium haemolyticum]MDH0343175.1 BLUF domain-containing protein [Chromobacterium haemolyticum]
MIRLIYSSAAHHPVSAETMHNRIRRFRDYNQSQGIASVLLMLNDDFLQILEGPEENIDALYQRIARDPLHHQLTLLSREEIDHPMLANHPLEYLAPSPQADGKPLSAAAIARDAGWTLHGKVQQVIQSFLDGKWHHHLPNGMNPQVLRRG